MKISKTGLDVSKGILKGATKGSLVGGAAAVATGAAVIMAAPAWIPIVGGAIAVGPATVAFWAAVGAGVGAASGGAIEYTKAKKRDKDFNKHFGPDPKG